MTAVTLHNRYNKALTGSAFTSEEILQIAERYNQ